MVGGAVFADEPARGKRLTRRARDYAQRAICAEYAEACDWRGMTYGAFSESVSGVGPDDVVLDGRRRSVDLNMRRYTRDHMLQRLAALYEKYNVVTSRLIRFDKESPSPETVAAKFGGLTGAFQAMFGDVLKRVRNDVFEAISQEARLVDAGRGALGGEQNVDIRFLQQLRQGARAAPGAADGQEGHGQGQELEGGGKGRHEVRIIAGTPTGPC